jgi:hypothetical protein
MAGHSASSFAIATSSEPHDDISKLPSAEGMSQSIETITTKEFRQSNTTGDTQIHHAPISLPIGPRNSDEYVLQMLVQLLQSPAAAQDPAGALQIFQVFAAKAHVDISGGERGGRRNISDDHAATSTRPRIKARRADTAQDDSSNNLESATSHFSRNVTIAEDPSYPLNVEENPVINDRRHALHARDSTASADPAQSTSGRAFGHKRNQSSTSNFAFPMGRSTTGSSSGQGNSASDIDDLQALAAIANVLSTIMSYSSQTTAVNSERESPNASSDEASQSDDSKETSG